MLKNCKKPLKIFEKPSKMSKIRGKPFKVTINHQQTIHNLQKSSKLSKICKKNIQECRKNLKK